VAIDESIHRAAEYYDVLGNGIRLSIILILGETKKHVSEIAEELERSQQVTSRHLKILRLEDILQSETDGRKRFFWVKRKEVLEDVKDTIEQFRRSTDTD
jgi:predicted transcriptional regulator